MAAVNAAALALVLAPTILSMAGLAPLSPGLDLARVALAHLLVGAALLWSETVLVRWRRVRDLALRDVNRAERALLYGPR